MWDIDFEQDDQPKYRQVADHIKALIDQRLLLPQDKLPTHRHLAQQLQVTVGTVTRAYGEAERRGLVQARVGAGTFVLSQQNNQKNSFIITTEPLQLTQQSQWLADFSFNFPVRDDRAPALKAAFDSLLSQPEQLNLLLEYQPEQGAVSQREAFMPWLQARGIDACAEQMLFSNGGQNGILLALMAIAKSGDTILTEGLTFPGIKSACYQLNLNLKGITYDEEGLCPEALAQACSTHRPVAVYCTPTLHNPSSSTMSQARREQIMAICQQYQVWLIEDDVNGLLSELSPPACAAIAPQQTIYIGSTSKIMAGGLRLGYLHVPKCLVAKFKEAIRANCWMVNPMVIAIVCYWLQSGYAAQLLQQQRQLLSQRHQLAQQYLSPYLQPSSLLGMHVWLNLPDYWRSEAFVQAAEQYKIALRGCEVFAVGQFSGPHGVRIAISNEPDIRQVEKGLSVLKQLIKIGPQAPEPIL